MGPVRLSQELNPGFDSVIESFCTPPALHERVTYFHGFPHLWSFHPRVYVMFYFLFNINFSFNRSYLKIRSPYRFVLKQNKHTITNCNSLKQNWQLKKVSNELFPKTNQDIQRKLIIHNFVRHLFFTKKNIFFL